MTRMRITAALVVAALLCPITAGAQAVRDSAPTQSIRQSMSRVDFGSIALTRAPVPAVQLAASGRERSIGRKIAGGAIGGVGGFFAGGYLGAKIDGECGGCDDPGLKGALIGAPIGAVVGAILGVEFF